MRRLLLSVLAGLTFNIEPSFAQEGAPFDASSSEVNSNIIAFVGQKVFVKDDENWPPEQDPSSDEIIIYMDGRYQARYKIETLVSGAYEGETIDFHAFDHYGIPWFSGVEDVLIFVHDGPKTRWHSKYNYYEVHRTTDGDWAACGDTYIQSDPEETEKEPLEEIAFLVPVAVNIPSLTVKIEDQLEPNEIITDAERAEWQAELDEENAETDGLYQPPIWERNGNIATCRMGTRVADLYKFQNEIRFLPNKREAICKARHSEKLDAIENDYKAENAILDECASLLEIQNLP